MRRVSLRIVLIFLCAFLLLSGPLTAAGRPTENAGPELGERTPLSGSGMTQVASRGSLTLLVDPATGEFRVDNTATGTSWHSNPPGREEDTTATGFNRLNMDSALIIHTINKRLVMDDTNSKIASVNKGGLTVYTVADGAVMEYRMPSEKITIPVACLLREDGVEVSILTREIREEGELRLVDCTLLPYMGSAGPQDTGYALLPDGSGALVEFSPGQGTAPAEFTYKKPVYGRDPVLSLRSKSGSAEEIRLPVFAVKTEKAATVGVVTQGDALTALELFAKGQVGLHTAVHPVMTYRNVDTTVAHEGAWNEKQIVVVNDTPADLAAYTVRYYLLEQTDYSGIAGVVAGHYAAMRDDGVQRPAGGASMTVQLLGAVRKPDSVLGVPTDTVYAATTYNQALAILGELRQAGTAGLDVVYHGVFAGGLYDKMPVRAKTEGKLGSKKERAALQDWAADHGVGLYPAVDLARVYRSGNGVSYKGDTARNVSGGFCELTGFYRSTFAPVKDGLSWAVLTSGRTGDVYGKLTAGLRGQGFAALADMGAGVIASDNHRAFFGSGKSTDRETAKNAVTAAAGEAAAALEGYMAAEAGAYLLPFATAVLDAPTASSRQRGFSREIPFYQLVASRLARISARPVNFESDRDAYVLRCLEYGMLPSVWINGSDTQRLANTDAAWLYAADRGEMTAWCAEVMRAYGEALAVVSASPLTGHRQVGEGAYESTFASGRVIAVDYAAGTAVVR